MNKKIHPVCYTENREYRQGVQILEPINYKNVEAPLSVEAQSPDFKEIANAD